MRQLIFVFLVLLGVQFLGCSASVDNERQPDSQPAETQIAAGNRPAVLVELFTSEGCSSCPPADRNLAFLENQQPVTKAEIVTLAFHVDYWDRLGWKDRFSSPLFSRRQEDYAQAFKLDSNYTPQMIVDGKTEFVGNNTDRATQEILKAAGSTKALVELSTDGGNLSVKITGAVQHSAATVYVAIAEDGVSTRVERGENSGKTLDHVSVVRELKTLGELAQGNSEFTASTDLRAPVDAKAENLKAIVFVQENEGRRIIGVGRTGLKL